MYNRNFAGLVDDITDSTILIMVANRSLTETIQLLCAEGVQVDGESKSDEESGERNAHGEMIACMIGGKSRQRRKERTTADGRDDPGRAALGVAAQTTDGERKDGGEDGGFEEEHNGEHGDTGLALGTHCGRDENHDHSHEEHEDPAGLHEHHGAGRGESTDCEQTLANRITIGCSRVADACTLHGVFDKLGSNTDLSADIAELGGDTEEELVLLAHGLVNVPGETRTLFGLESHVGIGDLGNRRKEEDHGQEKDKGGDAKVRPLNVGKIFRVSVSEEDSRRQKGRHDRADGLEGLGELQTELGQSWGTTCGDEGIGRSLESRKTGADDEKRAAKAAKRSIDGGRPKHEGTNTVDAESGDERPSVTKFADNPARVSEGANQVSAKVCTLQTSSLGGCNVQGILEFGVEDIEETVCETPQEEEHGDESDWEDGLLDGQGGGPSETSVRHALSVHLVNGIDIRRPALVHDLFDLRLFLLSPHVGG